MANKIIYNSHLNNDEIEQIKEALKANDGYCPCRIHKTPESKCVCKEFREAEVGSICHCGLYEKTI